jgi:hypothetical protein
MGRPFNCWLSARRVGLVCELACLLGNSKEPRFMGDSRAATLHTFPRTRFAQTPTGRRSSRAATPDDEHLEYLSTQAAADFLASESSVLIDGIVFPSVQAAFNVLNGVLFHRGARVKALTLPK